MHALRVLLKSPGTTAAAVISLALGIGANSALFTFVNAVLFKPLPVADADRVVKVYTNYPNGAQFANSSWPKYRDYERLNQVFEGLTAWSKERVNLGSGAEAEQVVGHMVSPNYFSVLGLQPLPGRGFRPDEESQRVAVISHPIWHAQFGGRTDIIGREVRINDSTFIVIGVAPRGFLGLEPDGADVWFPPVETDRSRLRCRECNWLSLAGRLKPGISKERAESEMRALALDIEQGDHKGATIALGSGMVTPRETSQIWTILALVFGALGLVLLIACANVANLLLARAAGRRREMGVRVALGAGRGRLVKQLLSESALLSVAAGVLAMLFSLWTTDILKAFQPPGDPRFAPNLSPDWRVITFTMLLALATAFIFGLAPALQASKPDVIAALKGESQGGRRSRLRTALVVSQVALSLVLLLSAGLLLRGFERALGMDPGFSSAQVLVVPLDLHLAGYDPERATGMVRQLEESLKTVPQVRSVSFAQIVPVGGKLMSLFMSPNPGERPRAISFNVVTPDYFQTLGIPLVAGRPFDARDRKQSKEVAIINETMARQFFSGNSALGQRFGENRIEVVGIAKDSRYLRLGETPRPHFYRPLAQEPRAELTLLVAAGGTPATALPQVRRIVESLDPKLPILGARTMAEQVRLSLWDSQQGATLAGAFGVTALILTAIGLYGVISYAVGRRTREIGIRMALGASRREVSKMVLRESFVLVAIGVAFGAAGAAAAGQVLRKFLYGVSPADPLAWAGVGGILVAVALLASWIPARRAARVDPMVALRWE
jgi:predicted permease